MARIRYTENKEVSQRQLERYTDAFERLNTKPVVGVLRQRNRRTKPLKVIDMEVKKLIGTLTYLINNLDNDALLCFRPEGNIVLYDNFKFTTMDRDMLSTNLKVSSRHMREEVIKLIELLKEKRDEIAFDNSDQLTLVMNYTYIKHYVNQLVDLHDRGLNQD